MNALTILYQGIDKIQQAIGKPELQLLRNEFYNHCDQNNKVVADKIGSISWNSYQQEMTKQLTTVLNSKSRRSIKAVYYEYDPDNNWEGAIFACLSYNNDAYEDDDWACDWKKSIQAPNIPGYTSLGIDVSLKTEQSAWIFLYAVLVLTETYSDIVHSLRANLPFCIGFHDQNPITRCS